MVGEVHRKSIRSIAGNRAKRSVGKATRKERYLTIGISSSVASRNSNPSGALTIDSSDRTVSGVAFSPYQDGSHQSRYAKVRSTPVIFSTDAIHLSGIAPIRTTIDDDQ
jgi:hypothetical protein